MGEDDEIEVGDVWRDPSDGELQLVRELETEQDGEDGTEYRFVWAGWDEASGDQGAYDRDDENASRWDEDNFRENFSELVARPGLQFAWRPMIGTAVAFEVLEVTGAKQVKMRNVRDGSLLTVTLKGLTSSGVVRLPERLPAGFATSPPKPVVGDRWLWVLSHEGQEKGAVCEVLEVEAANSARGVLVRNVDDGKETRHGYGLREVAVRIKEGAPEATPAADEANWVPAAVANAERGGYPLPAPGDVWRIKEGYPSAGRTFKVMKYRRNDQGQAIGVAITYEDDGTLLGLGDAVARVADLVSRAGVAKEKEKAKGQVQWPDSTIKEAEMNSIPLPEVGDVWEAKRALGPVEKGGRLTIVAVDPSVAMSVHYKALATGKEGHCGRFIGAVATLISRKADEQVTKDPASEDDATEDDKEETTMATRSKSEFKDVQVVRRGDQVILPEGMSADEAITWLKLTKEQDEKAVAFSHEINAYPLEGAYALFRALQRKFGFVSLADTPPKHFFDTDHPPTMVGLDVSPTEHVQVPWGRLTLPGVKGYIETSVKFTGKGEVFFVLAGQTIRKDEARVNEIVALVKEFISGQESIFRGRAIHITFPDVKNEEGFDPSYTPRYMNLSGVRKEQLIFPHETQELVETALFTPIERSALCRKLGIPLKRGVLLEGPFGVGKTLTASVTAKLCTENGWTFIYLDRTKDLQRALMFARNYQPAVIFAEDIDQQMSGDDRDEAMDGILNTIDGVDSKHQEVIVVLTTNHIDKVSRAMLRPGRLDAVIPVRQPDAEAAVRLVKLYAGDLLREGEDLVGTAGRVMAGMIPSVIGEVVQRAKLAAAKHASDDAERVELTAADLVEAASSIRAQLEHLNRPEQRELGEFERGCETLADAIRQRPEHEKANGLRGIAAAAHVAAEKAVEDGVVDTID